MTDVDANHILIRNRVSGHSGHGHAPPAHPGASTAPGVDCLGLGLFRRGDSVTTPIFATRQPLLIASARQVLLAAGILTDPQVVDPRELTRALIPGEKYLVLLDGQSLPTHDALTALCQLSPTSYFVVWAAHPTAEVLHAAIECGLHGLLSTRLPLDEAARILLRICKGERLFRFDSDPGPLELPKPLRLSVREQQVLFVLASGATNAEIATALGTTESTIKVCLSRMFRKTGVGNRQELLSLGRSGILVVEAPPRLTPPQTLAAGASFDAQWMLHGGDPRWGKI
jgi:DNA-binding NarL/FixJ family response regulator